MSSSLYCAGIGPHLIWPFDPLKQIIILLQLFKSHPAHLVCNPLVSPDHGAAHVMVPAVQAPIAPEVPPDQGGARPRHLQQELVLSTVHVNCELEPDLCDPGAVKHRPSSLLHRTQPNHHRGQAGTSIMPDQ